MADQYQVIYFKSVKEKIQQSYRRFRHTELEKTLIQAAATIDRALQNNPKDFGDPCYSSIQLNLDVFVRAVYPLVVHYGVHQIEPIVFVNRIEVFEPEQE